MVAVNLVIQAAEASGPDGGDIYFHSRDLTFGKISGTVHDKLQERVSLILVTFTSGSDSNFERSSISLKENKQDGID